VVAPLLLPLDDAAVLQPARTASTAIPARTAPCLRLIVRSRPTVPTSIAPALSAVIVVAQPTATRQRR